MDEAVVRDELISTTVLKRRAAVILDGDLDDDTFSLHFDGLERLDGGSDLGDFHYAPVLYCEAETLGSKQRQLLAIYGHALGEIQGVQPSRGIIIYGHGARVTTVDLTPGIRRTARLLDEIKATGRSEVASRLTLNEHCPACEFRERCRTQALKDDDLSLLRGITPQEVARQNRKGIFTVTQLSYTFRVRRRNKRAKPRVAPHSFALQALAIREKKVHVLGTFAIPSPRVSVYLDIEGLPEQGFDYLVGLVVVERGVERRYSFWADNEHEQPAIFERLLEQLAQYPDYYVFHFGDYDARALRRIKNCLSEGHQHEVDEVLGRAVNVLSIIYPHVYFPTYSCGLKDIGRHLGCVWSEPDASGLQSLAWRRAWEKGRDESLKARLVQYNTEDCLALRTVVDFLSRIAPATTSECEVGRAAAEVVHAEDLQKSQGRSHRFGKKDSSLPGFDFVNKCAYFEYQRDKVFARTSPRLKVIKQRKGRARRPALKVNKVIELTCKRCPNCHHKTLFQNGNITRQIIDLKYFRDGVKRWVTKYVSWHYSCPRCKSVFTHPEFPNATTKYGRGLVSWCIYQHFVGGQNMLRVGKVLREVFNLRLAPQQLYRFKTAVAECYETVYARILGEILKGPLIHIDETAVDLRGGKGYVWVLTNMEQVYFVFRDSREGLFLKEMLRGFTGVLVSDFFTAYDSLDCPQQKCLIHLLRDLNDDMLRNPFDEELKTLAHRILGPITAGCGDGGPVRSDEEAPAQAPGGRRGFLRQSVCDGGGVRGRPGLPKKVREVPGQAVRIYRIRWHSVEQRQRRARDQMLREVPAVCRRKVHRSVDQGLSSHSERLPIMRVPRH